MSSAAASLVDEVSPKERLEGLFGELAELTGVEVPTLRALYACVSLLNKPLQTEQVGVRGVPTRS